MVLGLLWYLKYLIKSQATFILKLARIFLLFAFGLDLASRFLWMEKIKLPLLYPFQRLDDSELGWTRHPSDWWHRGYDAAASGRLDSLACDDGFGRPSGSRDLRGRRRGMEKVLWWEWPYSP